MSAGCPGVLSACTFGTTCAAAYATRLCRADAGRVKDPPAFSAASVTVPSAARSRKVVIASVQAQCRQRDLAALGAGGQAGLGELHAAGAGEQVERVVGAQGVGDEVLLPLLAEAVE